MSPSNHEQVLAVTRPAAVSVYEDFNHILEIVEQAETSPMDLRHASVIARRWLVEGQLQRVANPRVGRIEVEAIDNNPIYRALRSSPVEVFVSGGASVHGVFVAGLMGMPGNRPPNIDEYHPDRLINLRLDSFTKQRVIFTEGDWVTRSQVIKFVANADFGVHGHGAREAWEERIARFRYRVSISSVLGPDGRSTPSVQFGIGPPAEDIGSTYDPSRVNGALLELLATLHFLAKSDCVKALIASIRDEIRS